MTSTPSQPKRPWFTGQRFTGGQLLATIAMMVCVASANFLAQFGINEWLAWGTLVYTMTFLVTELTNRFFGPQIARRVVYVGFVVALMASLAVAPWRIALASTTAFLVAQLADIAIFSRLRRGAWWLAPAAASVLASALDTLIFFPLAFLGTQHAWWRLATGDFLIKLTVDLLMLGPFRLAVQRRQRQQQELEQQRKKVAVP